jgi:uncharacterized protein YbjT (DUF2867 family)
MILITSATGTVGSEVVKRLKAQGLAVTAASRLSAKASADLGVPAVTWHWDQPQGFAAALEGVETLFLGTPPGSPDELSGGLAAVAAAKRAGVRKIVKLSAIGAEKMPDSAHRRVELAIEAAGVEWFFARPGFFMQNFNEGMLKDVLSGVIARPAGDGRTSFIDARDIAAVLAVAVQGDSLNGQALALTGSEALSYGDLAAELSRATGRPLRYEDVPAADFKAALLAAGVPRQGADFMTSFYDQVVRRGFAATVTDGVKRATGRDPLTLAQYARDYAAVFKAPGAR